MQIRTPHAHELGALANLWHSGWHDGHAGHVPDELVALRTLPDFTRRLVADHGSIRAAYGPKLLGFYMLKGAELYQFYVAPEARGTGVATTLIQDAERRLVTNGIDSAFLDCALGNTRARRFYEKGGWRNAGLKVARLDTSNGPFELQLVEFRKSLHPN